LLGIWRRDEALYADEFLAIANKHQDFRFHACYSREMPDDVASHEYHGHVQARLGQLALNPEKDIVYMCGNPDMIDQVLAECKEQGFPIAHLRREKYLSARS